MHRCWENTVYHTQAIQICIGPVGILGCKKGGKSGLGRIRVPCPFRRGCSSRLCPGTRCWKPALAHQPAPLPCPPERLLQTTTLPCWHLLPSQGMQHSPQGSWLFTAKAEKLFSRHQPGLVRISSRPCGCWWAHTGLVYSVIYGEISQRGARQLSWLLTNGQAPRLV